jgi:hypothetical protein
MPNFPPVAAIGLPYTRPYQTDSLFAHRFCRYESPSTQKPACRVARNGVEALVGGQVVGRAAFPGTASISNSSYTGAQRPEPIDRNSGGQKPWRPRKRRVAWCTCD